MRNWKYRTGILFLATTGACSYAANFGNTPGSTTQSPPETASPNITPPVNESNAPAFPPPDTSADQPTAPPVAEPVAAPATQPTADSLQPTPAPQPAPAPDSAQPTPVAQPAPAPEAAQPIPPAAPVPVTATPAAETGSQGTSVSNTQVQVSDAGLVEIHVNDANLVEVLRMLSIQSQKNIIASKEVTGTVTANLYDVTVNEALDEILKANGYRYREHGNFIEVYGAKEFADIEKSERKVTTEIFRVHYTPAANIVNMIKPILSQEGQVAFTTPAVTGIDASGTGSGNTGGDSHATEDTLVVTDYPDNLQKIAKVIREVDRRPDQILIEATILETTLNNNNSLGINFSALDGVNFSTLQNVTGTLGTSPLAALSGSIFNGTGAAAGGGTAGGTSGATGGTTPGAIAANGYGGANTAFPLPTGGLNVGIVTNNLSVFLSALETATNTTVVANPKLLVLNKQQGTVLVGSELGYLTTTNTETTSSQTVNYLDTGVKLIVRPYVGTDGFIRMEIHPEDSSGALDSNGVPSKQTTEVTSNVMVKDGHTIVIGGLFRDASTTTRSQIPFLGDIPILGYLFRSKTDTTSRQEITVLLTPHIIHNEKAYADASQDELEQAEKLRVGVRKDMMPFGMERLAEGEYEQALKELKKPNPDRCKVLWHLNAATDLNPTFSEAINLKESVTGEVVTDVDNSTIRSFVQRMISTDAANPTTQPAVPWEMPITSDYSSSPQTHQVHLLPSASATPTAQEPAVAVVTKPTDAEVPTTQPTVAMGPATKPSVAEAPSTQPSVAEASKTQPNVAAAQPTQPAIPGIASIQPTEADASSTNASVADASTTQPSIAVTETNQPAVVEESNAEPPAAAKSVPQSSVAAAPTTHVDPWSMAADTSTTQPSVATAKVAQESVAVAAPAPQAQPAATAAPVAQPAVAEAAATQPAPAVATAKKPAASTAAPASPSTFSITITTLPPAPNSSQPNFSITVSAPNGGAATTAQVPAVAVNPTTQTPAAPAAKPANSATAVTAIPTK